MSTRILLIGTALIALSGCGAAEEALDAQIRDQFVQRCEGVAENLGIAADAVTPMCGCSADKLLEKDMSELASVDQQRIEEILGECADETSGVSIPDQQPAENATDPAQPEGSF